MIYTRTNKLCPNMMGIVEQDDLIEYKGLGGIIKRYYVLFYV